MSAQDSNLESVGYDMVVGLTQNSINKTMKNYLLDMDTPIPPVLYVFEDDSCTSVRMLNSEETEEFMQEADPFSIPNGTVSTDVITDANEQAIAAGNILYDKLFAYGFKATMGLPIPEGTPPYDIQNAVAKLPNLIQLPTETSAQTVNYNLYYKNFQIVQQIGGRSSWSYESLEQTEDNPWIFNYDVNLNLSSTNESFDNLSPEQQAVFKNLDPNTMFSVSQLMLDLTAPVLQSGGIEIEGLDPTDPNYSDIVSFLGIFTTSYWDSLKESGDVVFSSSVTPVSTDLPESTLIPTDLNFIIKPYTTEGESLTDDEREDLSTLNYIIMDSGHGMPNPLNNLSWDWLNQQEDIDNDGIMSVSKARFVDYLNTALSPCLNTIFLTPVPDIAGPDKGIIGYGDNHDDDYKYEVDYSKSNNKYSFTEDGQGNNQKVLWTGDWYSGSNTDEDDDFGKMTCYNKAYSNVSLKGNQIICECFIATHLDLDIVQTLHLGHANIAGWAYATKMTTKYDITINGEGVIHLSVAQTDKEDLIDNGYSSGQLYDPSMWDEMAASDEFVDCMKKMSADCASALDKAMDNYSSNIMDLLNDITQWVFPGANAFAFENCKFSNNQDFLTTITYAATS